MKTCGQLAQYLLSQELEPQSPVLALSQYIRVAGLTAAPLNSTFLDQFLFDALHHPSWQAAQNSLREVLFEIFEELLQQKLLLDPFWRKSRLAHSTQVIRVEGGEEFYKIIKNFEQGRLKEAENLRVLPDGEEKLVCLILESKGNLNVRTYSRLTVLVDGKLTPLSCLDEISYNPNLELQPSQIHKIYMGPGLTWRFKAQEGQIKGYLSQGAVFQPSQSVDTSSIRMEQRIFIPLKRLERFYVYRPTDPDYLAITEMLEKAIEAFRNGHPQAPQMAQDAFEKGSQAFESIFVDDKALFRLLRELATTISFQGSHLRPVTHEKAKNSQI